MEVICPLCKGTNLAYILFGYPSEGMRKAAATDHFILGGCVPLEEHWYCEDCKRAVKIKTAMPCAYCEQCHAFLAPEHVEITTTEEAEEWTCSQCESLVKRKQV